MRVLTLSREDLAPAIAGIDRSEHVDVQYQVADGRLGTAPVVMAEVPIWEANGDGPYSVSAQVDFCASVLDRGGVALGAVADDPIIGVAVVHPTFEPLRAWLAFLHVTRLHRRTGVATRLWKAACELAAREGAQSIYVSATPTGSAVGFYLRQGCRLANPVHAELQRLEPDDIQLSCELERS